jgi:Family of unknown function (DUF6152)
MERRLFLGALSALPLAAHAHHGWSSFDTARPIYLEGRAVNVAWRNPHVEFDLDLAPDLKLPADLAQRAVPPQSAPVDGAVLLKTAQLPTRRDKRWHIELAPLSRIEAWKVPPLKNGDAVSMLGFTFAGEKGDAVLRVEYLFSGGRTYGMRSSPA